MLFGRRLHYRDSCGRWRQDRRSQYRSSTPTRFAVITLLVIAGIIGGRVFVAVLLPWAKPRLPRLTLVGITSVPAAGIWPTIFPAGNGVSTHCKSRRRAPVAALILASAGASVSEITGGIGGP